MRGFCWTNVSTATFCKVIMVLWCEADMVFLTHYCDDSVMEKQRNMIKCGEEFNVEKKTSSAAKNTSACGLTAPFEAALNSRQMPKRLTLTCFFMLSFQHCYLTDVNTPDRIHWERRERTCEVENSRFTNRYLTSGLIVQLFADSR